MKIAIRKINPCTACLCPWKKDKQEKKEGHFDLIMWVHVSQIFDVVDIFKKILQEATRDSCLGLSNLNTLEDKLEAALSGKRFLLVLDDVWYKMGENQNDLQKVVSLLKAGEAGSKILATSRTEEALLALGAVKEKCIPISEMDDSAFLKLFMYYALKGVSIDEQDRRTFEAVGAQIAKKLKGSPLAATIVGTRLRVKPLNYWINFNARQHLGDVMEFLKWSYQHFDKEVRRCFAYCCIFPRRYQLKRDELVKLWVAQGFISVTNGEEKEDIAQRHFDHLLSALFLRPKGWTGHLPRDVRHLFIEIYGEEMISKKVLELQNLRTLIIIHTQHEEELLVEDVLETVFTNLTMLRAFILKVEVRSFMGGRQISIPESIGDLLHLRYFYLSKALYSKVTFPRRFARLYLMEVLDVGYSQWGKVAFSSGEDTTNLINLRVVPYDSELDFPFIGRMESLQTLHKFTVKKEKGHELFQLKKLNKVRHVLKIDGLENVLTKEDAQQAELHEKACIRGLILTWSPSGDMSLQEQDLQSEVIQALGPPTHLQILAIEGYKGSSYPSWMTGDGPEVLMCLRDLLLIDCTELASIPEHSVLFKYLHALEAIRCNWRCFPDNMEHLNSLVKLGIQSCNEILSLPTLPQSLKKLKIKECEQLESLPTIPVSSEIVPQSLKVLIIEECKNLMSLPTLPESLGTLVISFCSIDLPSTLPQSLKKLMLHGFSKIDLSTIPPSLEHFDVLTHDQEFATSCKTDGHENWEKIRHIPETNIRYEEFYREDDEDEEGLEDDEDDDSYVDDEEEDDDVPLGEDQEVDVPSEDGQEDDVPSEDDQDDES
ncbi:disease resistance protein RGA2-like [Oryza brachyantha]|nr:disease resistance protein RGA2-like [Oryza brachyantha]